MESVKYANKDSTYWKLQQSQLYAMNARKSASPHVLEATLFIQKVVIGEES